MCDVCVRPSPACDALLALSRRRARVTDGLDGDGDGGRRRALKYYRWVGEHRAVLLDRRSRRGGRLAKLVMVRDCDGLGLHMLRPLALAMMQRRLAWVQATCVYARRDLSVASSRVGPTSGLVSVVVLLAVSVVLPRRPHVRSRECVWWRCGHACLSR